MGYYCNELVPAAILYDEPELTAEEYAERLDALRPHLNNHNSSLFDPFRRLQGLRGLAVMLHIPHNEGYREHMGADWKIEGDRLACAVDYAEQLIPDKERDRRLENFDAETERKRVVKPTFVRPRKRYLGRTLFEYVGEWVDSDEDPEMEAHKEFPIGKNIRDFDLGIGDHSSLNQHLTEEGFGLQFEILGISNINGETMTPEGGRRMWSYTATLELGVYEIIMDREEFEDEAALSAAHPELAPKRIFDFTQERGVFRHYDGLHGMHAAQWMQKDGRYSLDLDHFYDNMGSGISTGHEVRGGCRYGLTDLVVTAEALKAGFFPTLGGHFRGEQTAFFDAHPEAAIVHEQAVRDAMTYLHAARKQERSDGSKRRLTNTEFLRARILGLNGLRD